MRPRKTGQHSWVHGLPFKMRFHRSKLYISAVPPAMIGAFVGFMAAIMGVGGGFVIVPAMIYLLRVPTSVVIGTSLFQIVFVMAVTTLLQAMQNKAVDIVLALLLIVGGVIGAQFGAVGRWTPQGRAAALHAGRARAARLPAYRLGPDEQAGGDLLDRPGSWGRLLMRRALMPSVLLALRAQRRPPRRTSVAGRGAAASDRAAGLDASPRRPSMCRDCRGRRLDPQRSK